MHSLTGVVQLKQGTRIMGFEHQEYLQSSTSLQEYVAPDVIFTSAFWSCLRRPRIYDRDSADTSRQVIEKPIEDRCLIIP